MGLRGGDDFQLAEFYLTPSKTEAGTPDVRRPGIGVSANGQLEIVSTANQDNPIMARHFRRGRQTHPGLRRLGTRLLPQYQNRRADISRRSGTLLIGRVAKNYDAVESVIYITTHLRIKSKSAFDIKSKALLSYGDYFCSLINPGPDQADWSSSAARHGFVSWRRWHERAVVVADMRHGNQAALTAFAGPMSLRSCRP